MRKIFIVLFVIFILLFVIACDSTHKDSVVPPNNFENNNEHTGTNKKAIDVKFNNCSNFYDGYAMVAYKENGVGYGAIIDVNGNIIYKEECSASDIDSWSHLGNGIFYIDYAIINSNGETILSPELGDFDYICTAADGIIVARKKIIIDTINGEYEYYTGAFDLNGNLISEFKKAPTSLSIYNYHGDGVFGGGNWGFGKYDEYQLYDSKSGNYIYLKNLYSDSFEFINRVAYVNESLSMYSSESESIIKLPRYIALYADGTYTEVPAFWKALNGRIIDNRGEYLTITDPISKKTITYDHYPASNVVNVECFDDYILIVLSGKGGDFFTVVDNNGKQRFDPIKCGSTLLSNFHCNDKEIVYYVGGEFGTNNPPYYFVVSAEDGSLLMDKEKRYEMFGFYNEISKVRVQKFVNYRDQSYYIYINKQGEQILEKLYERQ